MGKGDIHFKFWSEPLALDVCMRMTYTTADLDKAKDMQLYLSIGGGRYLQSDSSFAKQKGPSKLKVHEGKSLETFVLVRKESLYLFYLAI